MTEQTILHRDPDAPSTAYFDARRAIEHLLDVDPSGWENLFIALRRIAADRKAAVIEAELSATRSGLDRAARQQAIADQWTDHADALDRIRDGFKTEGGD